MSDFNKLSVYKKSYELTLLIYNFTKKLPDCEKFGLVNQINRCGVSIPSNIAEGSSRSSDKDFARFLEIALGSSYELEVQVSIAIDVYSQNKEQYVGLKGKITEIQKMLNGMIKKLKE